jgi:bifunctional N-acetylglucosamine-1-phosphate-uridyltransferase/glucosamine-1-phosphate-acetyltransferase GlmU-like protein
MSKADNPAPIGAYIASWRDSIFGRYDVEPWRVTWNASAIIREAVGALDASYALDRDVAVHESAVVEPGAIIKGPAILGPYSFVAASAYLRGGVFLDRECIVGPACELKSVFMLSGAKVAHLSFVGDAIIGARTNIEAGAIIANYRNEMADKRIRIVHKGLVIDTGLDKFGALIGDDVRIGANAVVAPGAIIEPGAVIPRLGNLDQHPASIIS